MRPSPAKSGKPKYRTLECEVAKADWCEQKRRRVGVCKGRGEKRPKHCCWYWKQVTYIPTQTQTQKHRGIPRLYTKCTGHACKETCLYSWFHIITLLNVLLMHQPINAHVYFIKDTFTWNFSQHICPLLCIKPYLIHRWREIEKDKAGHAYMVVTKMLH